MLGIFTTLRGASGIVKITAPAPYVEYTLDPIMFCADTIANTLDPHPRLNGVAKRTVIGTEQIRVVELTVLQLVRSYWNVTPSNVLILTMYPVIELPPLYGATHVISTLYPFTEVVGAVGTLGT